MSRNPEIEAILAAWWEMSNGPEVEKSSARRKLDLLLSTASQRSKGELSPEQILLGLSGHFEEFRRQKARSKASAMPRRA